MEELMLIDELTIETIDDLCSTLEKPSLSVGWRGLMTKGFATLYSEHDANDIAEKEERPARALLYNLIARQVTLQELVYALEGIGNKKALSIIEKGNQLGALCDHEFVIYP